jgi:transaldolase
MAPSIRSWMSSVRLPQRHFVESAQLPARVQPTVTTRPSLQAHAGGRCRLAAHVRSACLWASTGTKDAGYSDVKYVESLVCPDTVTTMPPETLIAYRDHGRAMPWSSGSSEDAHLSVQRLARELADAGIDWLAVAQQLEEDGIRKFVQPHEATLALLRERVAALR